MPLFIHYPCRPDGSFLVFESWEDVDDQAACERGRRVLAGHPSAVRVVIWQGERRVGAVSRVADPA